MTVRPARPEDVTPLAAMLARAFHDDPVTAWVYAGARRRAHWARRFFRWQIERLLPQEVTWTAEGHDGAALWALPGHWREDTRESLALVRATLPGILPRLPRLVRGLTQVEERHPATRHLYLVSLGVEPDRQRQGLGSRLLAPGLELCDREGLPAYLETSKERNLAFYARHGFVVTGELLLPKGPPIWFLWRAAPGSS